MALAMGPPPDACHNLQTAILLQTRLVNVTAPDGSVSTFTLTPDTEQPIKILVHSKYTVELTLQTPKVADAQMWLHVNYSGYEDGACVDIPSKSDVGSIYILRRSPKTKKTSLKWTLPLDVQLTNISPEGGVRTVEIYGADADMNATFDITFDVDYLPATD